MSSGNLISRTFLNININRDPLISTRCDGADENELKVYEDSIQEKTEIEGHELQHQTAVTKISRTDGVYEFVVINIRSGKDVFNLLESVYNDEDPIEIETLFVIRFKFSENIDLNPKYFDKINGKLKKYSILIICECLEDGSFSTYWKINTTKRFLSVVVNKILNLDEKQKLNKYLTDFLIQSLKSNHSGLNKQFSQDFSKSTIQLDFLADNREFNLLLLASECGNSDIVRILLKFNLKTTALNNKIDARIVAQKNDHWDVLYELMHANLTFPESFDVKKCTGKFKEFCDITIKVHLLAIDDNVEEVEKIPLINRKVLKYLYDFQNQSLLKVTLINKSFRVFDFLLSKGYRFGSNEDACTYFEELTEIEKRKCREIQNKYSKEFVDKTINSLVERSTACYDENEVEDKRNYVERAFKLLNENPFIKILLLILAASKNFKIFFDFNRDAVNFMDPTNNGITQGVFYVTGKIYIGAEQLLNQKTEHETLAVLAHEICHYVMNLVFENDAKPYKSGDKETKKEFKKISEYCQENSDFEDVIEAVYEQYENKEVHHAELIVRVVHLMALYRNLPEKLEEVRTKFNCLFEFYENKLFPQLEKALPEIEGRDERKLHKKVSKFKKLSLICSILAILGVIAACLCYWHLIKSTKKYEYNSLGKTDKIKVENGTVLYKGVKLQFKDLFPIGSIAYSKISSEQISQIFQNHKLDFNDYRLGNLDKLVEHNWDNMTEKLKKKFLNSNFTFQDESLKFQKLYDLIPDAFKSLTSEQIIHVLSGDHLEIHKMIQREAAFYIERKFIDEDILGIYIDYLKPAENCAKFKICGETLSQTDFVKAFENFVGKFKSQDFSIQIEKLKKVEQHSCARYGYYKNQLIDCLLSKYEHIYYMNFSSIFKEAKRLKVHILSAEAGIGKTATFEEFTVRIKKLHPTKWVSYIDLKDFKHFYNSSGTIGDAEKLLENIFSLSSKNMFEREIFRNLYKSGDVILLWNGYDEISPHFSDFILNVLNEIKQNSMNIQFVCTRPNYSKQLKSEVRSSVYELFHLTKEKQDEFLKEFLLSQKIKQEKFKDYIKKIHEVIESTDSDESLDSPLLLKMIAELISNDSDIYESGNIYDIFYQFFSKKIKMWSETESGRKFLDPIENPGFNIWRLYEKYAIKTLTDNFALDRNFICIRLKIVHEKFTAELTNDEISRMGILYKNDEKDFKFSHRTFAEFLFAQFLIDSILNSKDLDSDPEAPLLVETLFFKFRELSTFSIGIKFLNSYQQSKIFKKKNKKIFLNVPNVIKSKFKDYPIKSTLLAFYNDFFFNLLKNDENYLKELLTTGGSRTVFSELHNFYYYTIFQFNHDFSVSNIVRTKNLVRDTLINVTQNENFIYGKNQKGIILFSMHCYHHISLNIKDIFSDFSYTLDEEILKNGDKYYALEMIAKDLTHDELKELFTSKRSPIFVELKNISRLISISHNYNLTTDERKKMIDSIIFYYDEEWFNLRNRKFLATDLLTEIESLFSDDEIFNLFYSKNYKSYFLMLLNNFEIWNFFVNHTTREQQEFMLQTKIEFVPSSILLASYMLNPLLGEKTRILPIYKSYFNNDKIQEIISSSDNFIIDVIHISYLSEFDICGESISDLKQVFLGSERSLKRFILQSIKPTNLNIFELLSDIDSVKECYEKFSDLLKSLR